MRYLHIFLIVLLILVVVIFAAYNIESVVISFLGWSASLPLALLVVGVYILGMFTGGFVWSAIRGSVRGARRRH